MKEVIANEVASAITRFYLYLYDTGNIAMLDLHEVMSFLRAVKTPPLNLSPVEAY